MTIYYLENRAWFLGAEILLNEAVSRGQTIELRKFEDQPEQKLEDILKLPKTAKVVVRSTSLWTMYTKYPDALVFRFDEETDKVIREHVGLKEEYPMLSLRLAIHASGVLQLLSQFEIPQIDDKKNLETITDLLAESFDRLYPFLVFLVERAHDAGVIRKSPHLHFGVPPGEPAAGPYNVYGSHCNAFDAYSYNQDFIVETDDDDVAKEFASRSGLDEKTAEIGEICLRWGRSMRVWSGASEAIRQGLRTILAVEPIEWERDLFLSENGLVRAIVVDSLQLSKLAVTSTAQTVYAKLLMRSVTQEESLEPEQLRSIMDLNNGILQQLSLYEWRLDDEQSELLKLLKEKGWGQGAIDVFRSAEASLVAATEGLESLASRRLSRATESILFVLTILSVYSIASDVATFLGSGDDLRFPSPPSRIGVIIGATAIISLVLVLIWQRRASIRPRRKHLNLRK